MHYDDDDNGDKKNKYGATKSWCIYCIFYCTTPIVNLEWIIHLFSNKILI